MKPPLLSRLSKRSEQKVVVDIFNTSPGLIRKGLLELLSLAADPVRKQNVSFARS